jgi:hypothetical protein
MQHDLIRVRHMLAAAKEAIERFKFYKELILSYTQ